MLVEGIGILVGGKPMFIAGMDLTVFNFEVFLSKFGNGSIGIAVSVKLGLWDRRCTDNSAEGADKNGDGGKTHDDL